MFGFNIVVALFSRSSLSVTLCKEGGWGRGGGLITGSVFMLPDGPISGGEGGRW